MKKSEEVDLLIAALRHPLINIIEELRKIILLSGLNLKEEVKWNAPSYANANGQHRFTMNFPPNQKCIRLIFHRDAIKQPPPLLNLIHEDFGLLRWAATDRAILELSSLEQLLNDQSKLPVLLGNWLAQTS